jgi:hypothetical protein
MADLNFKIVFDTASGTMALKQVEQGVKGVGEAAARVKENVKGFGSSFSMMAVGLNQGLELARKGFEFLSTPLKAAGQFEAYETSLKVMLGTTEKAKARLQEYVEFAKTTPFELPAVVEAGNKLQAIGKYSKDNMTMLGDLAAAAGKPYEQVLSAYSKLATGQKGVAVDMFRDLLITSTDWEKATGKGKKASGEMIASADEMLAVLPNIVKAKNFAGMMDEQSKTMLGQFSNLQDGIGQFAQAVGNQLMGVAKDTMAFISPVFPLLQENAGGLIKYLGIAGGSLIAYSLLTKLAKADNLSLGTSFKSLWTSIKTAVTTNPIGILVASVTALYVGMQVLKDANNHYGEDLKKTTDEVKNAKKALDDYNSTTAILVDEYNALSKKENQSADDKKRMKEIIVDMVKKYPELIQYVNAETGELKSSTSAADFNRIVREKLNKTYSDSIGKLKELYIESQKTTQGELGLMERLQLTLTGMFKGGAAGQAKEQIEIMMNAKNAGQEAFKQLAKSWVDNIDIIDIQNKNYKKITTDFYNSNSELLQGKSDYEQQKIKDYIRNLVNLRILEASVNKPITETKESEGWDVRVKKFRDGLTKLTEAYKTGNQDLIAAAEESAQTALKETKVSVKLTEQLTKELDAVMGKTKGGKKDSKEKTFAEATLAQQFKARLESAKKDLDNQEITDEYYLNELSRLNDELITNKEFISLKELKASGELNKKSNIKKLEQYDALRATEIAILKIQEKAAEDDAAKLEASRKSILEKSGSDLESALNVAIGNTKDQLTALSKSFTAGEISDTDFLSGLDNIISGAKNKSDMLIELFGGLGTDIGKQMKTVQEQIESGDVQQEFYTRLLNQLKIIDPKLAKQYEDNNKTISDAVNAAETTLSDSEKFMNTWGGAIMQGFSDTFSAIGKAFEESVTFTSLGKGLKEGFKAMLVDILNFIEKEYILAGLYTTIKSIFDGGISAIVNLPLLLAAGAGIEAAKAGIMSMATGGLITEPTFVVAGDNGDELFAPKKDFLTVAKEIFMMGANTAQLQPVNRGTNITVNVKGDFQGSGRTLKMVLDKTTVYENKRFIKQK